MSTARVATRQDAGNVSRRTDPELDASIGHAPPKNREYIATAESFLTGDSFARVPAKIGLKNEVENEVEELVTDSPFLDLASPIGVYEGLKCIVMFPVVILKVSGLEVATIYLFYCLEF